MSATLELAMILRWRGEETREGLTRLQGDLRRTGEVGRATTDRLIDGTRSLEQSNTALGRQQAQTANTIQAANGRLILGSQRLADVGRTTADRLVDGARRVEQADAAQGAQQVQTANAAQAATARQIASSQRMADAGSSTADRLAAGMRRIEQADAALGAQQTQTAAAAQAATTRQLIGSRQLAGAGRDATDRLVEGTTRLTQANNALGAQQTQTTDAILGGSERLVVGSQRLETAGRALQRQNVQTGEAGRATTDRLITGTRDLERGTTFLGRAYDGLMRRLWELGRQRPGDQLADSMRRAREEADRTTSAFDRVKTAGRLAGGLAAGAAAAKFVLAEPMNKTMDYGMRLAGMSNTAFADRDVAGRIEGKKELNDSVVQSVRYGGGTRDQAAGTLDTLIAAGTMSVSDAMAMLPGLTKASTASGADPNQLANIALRSMATFKIDAKDMPKVMDMAITAGQEGGFELKDMAKWLPQQMAAGRMSGLSGLDGLAKILAANQASVITAGSKDEAGNNLVNFLAKINSQDTASDAKKLGIDLPGTLAAARAKGMDSMDAFVRLTDITVGKDKRYQELRKNAGNAKGVDARANLESQADIIEGSAIGKLIQDRQALMYLVAALNNRDYIKDVEGKVKQASGTTEKNFAVMSNETGFKKQQQEQEGEIATYTGFSKLDGPMKAVLDHLTASAREYPNFTAGMKVATTALTALAAAAGAVGLANILTRGGAAAAAGAAGSAGASAAAGAAGVAGGSILARMTASIGGALRSLLTTSAFAASMPATSFAAAAPAAAAGGVAAAGAAGYGIGTLISKAIEGTAFSDAIGRSIAIAMAAMGSKDARGALDSEQRNKPVEVHVKVTTDNAHIAAEVISQQERQALRR